MGRGAQNLAAHMRAWGEVWCRGPCISLGLGFARPERIYRAGKAWAASGGPNIQVSVRATWGDATAVPLGEGCPAPRF